MGKDQLFHIPILGFLLRKLGIISVKRGGNDLTAIKTSMKVLSGGNRLLVFPEGTRVDGQGDAEAKGGVTMMAVRTGVPMVPVYCGGKHKFLRKTTIVFGEPYVPVIVVGAQQRAALRQVLQPHRPVGKQQPDQRRRDRVSKKIKPCHNPVRSLMISIKRARLSWKLISVVSSVIASAAGRRGAAARFISFSSRSRVSRSSWSKSPETPRCWS